MEFVFNDGGRKAAGFKGSTGDCVVRAIAIATGQPYRAVYDALFAIARDHLPSNPQLRRGGASPRKGVQRRVYDNYLKEAGWRWTPTMRIGSGCRVHLYDGELPAGKLIVRLSGHLTTVIDGVIHDTYDPQRTTMITEGGVTRFARRCVYGYWQPPVHSDQRESEKRCHKPNLQRDLKRTRNWRGRFETLRKTAHALELERMRC